MAAKKPSKKVTPRKPTPKKTAPKKKAGFLGRVVEAPLDRHLAPLGVRRAHQVVIPTSKADLATAVSLSRGMRTFVRSGIQAATGDAVDAAGGIVINLAELKNVDVKKGVVNAEPAVSVGTISKHLTEHGLALPLADNPALSVASNVLQDGPSCLMRTLGPLNDYVTRLSAVTSDAQPVVRAGASAVARVVAERAVISGVVFTPVPAKNLWMLRRSFPYPGKDQFLALAKALFLNTRLPARSDVVLDAFPGRHNISMLRITAAGALPKDVSTVTSLVDNALAALPPDYANEIIREAYAAGEVIQSIVDGGFDLPMDSAIQSERFDQVVAANADLDAFLNGVAGDVDQALAFRADGTGEVNERLRMITRIQMNPDNRVRLSGFVLRPVRPGVAPPPLLAAVRPLARAEALLHPTFSLFPPTPARIPGFRGNIYMPEDASYADRAHQYATSSYPAAAMSPFMLAFPRDEDDIKAAILFARSKKKKVVARSGGHQYSGKSSGGDDTIVLVMDVFDHCRVLSETEVEVGPAVRLTDLAAEFASRGITIPHGECPKVCIGGHAQTGGFGHLARAFGLALDHVKAIRIVLADGTVRTLNRPSGDPKPGDEELFWGVLGGNAGSFGIVTSYRFACVKDDDHRNSFGYAAIRKYDKNRYFSLMKHVEDWTQKVVAGTLPADLDFMMTIESRSAPFLPPILLVELVHSDIGTPVDPVIGHPLFQPIIDAADTGAGVWRIMTTRGQRPLSFWSDKFVRRFPGTTPDGREFRYPYKKRINCTFSALTNQFIDQFVDLLDEVVENTDDVCLVFQMLIGGGNFKASKGAPRRKETSLPQRDYVYCFVFDLFYDEGYEAAAVALQGRMQTLIDNHYSGGQERRMFWGSFGNSDMSDPAVQAMYYDDPASVTKLKLLKKTVDPADVFHTSFTIKP